MKLKRENLTKSVEDAKAIYKYTYEETDFFLTMSGAKGTRKIEVFKGSMDDKQELLETDDSLKAWNYFEDLIEAMAEAQGSSGGFKNNPQENPNIMPFLAIKFDTNIGGYDCTFFVKLDDGTQQRVFDFHISFDAMPMQFQSPNVETVDWKEQEVPALFKCEVLLKYMSGLEFEEDKEKSVFLFIPKSIMEQGGEKGGGEPTDEEGEGKPTGETTEGKPSDKAKKENRGEKSPQKGEKGEKGEKKDEGGESSDEEGEPSDEDGQDGKGKPTGKKSDKKGGKPSDEKSDEKGGDEDGENGEPSDEEDEDDDEDSKSKDEPSGDKSPARPPVKIDFSETVQKIADISGRQPSQLLATFRTKNLTETWLNTNNFENIKRGLNLPASTTASQLAEQIINSK